MSYPNEGFTDPDSISDAGSRGSGPNLAIPQVGGFLSVENYNSELNQHTYVYDADRSFAGMTLEALPTEDNYRDVRSLNDGARPTVEELKSGQRNVVDLEEELEEEKKLKGKVVKFGWIEGVYMRCLLNIWGVMLFLRLTQVIGQCGILQGVLVIILANVVTSITAISMSAVATNGQIKAGGIYYMISRSLGPEFGGAIGIMFTVANSIAVATYVIGFCDALLDMLYWYIDGFEGIVSTNRDNDIRLVGTGVCIAVLALAIVGMDWVTRVQIGLLVLLLISQVDFFVGTFMPQDHEGKYGFVGYSMETFSHNFLNTNYHDYESDKEPSFFSWFGVFFPAVTGIVAGANLSGDLKDPSQAIPLGTLLAIGTTLITYVLYGMMIGGVYIDEASGDIDEFWEAVDGNRNLTHFDDCKNEIRFEEGGEFCIFGSSNDQQTLSKISLTGVLVYIGCFAATLSSAIASLVGAPRVLQALARDNLYPGLGIFGKGFGANDDPFNGYILVFFISLACTLIAQLDFVSTLLSNFFVAAYALINFSVFHATITKAPSWRPTFRYYNAWVSLLGTVLCIAVMFLMSWLTALITYVIIAILYFYIAYRKPDANWGSTTQAQQFVTTLRSVQRLTDMDDHIKNYRPKILVLSGIPAHRLPLIDFATLLTRKLSLLIFADVQTEMPLSALDNLRATVNRWLRDHNTKGFYAVTGTKTFEDGAISHMNLAGLGKMSPNMILLGFKADWQKKPEECSGYFNVISHGIDLHMAVAILRLKGGCDYSKFIAVEENQMVAAKEEYGAGFDSDSDDGKKKKKKKKKEEVGKTVYKGPDGRPIPRNILSEYTQFQANQYRGDRIDFIDVWWLYDDGGLTLLLPYILSTRPLFNKCKLRVFSLANRADELARETRNMAALLAKFRIDYSDVIVIPDVTKKAKEETKKEFLDILSESSVAVPDAELQSQKERTNRHLRLAELLRDHSLGSEAVIMTLPMPRKGTISPQLYMGWLEIMTKDMPPFLLVRGNQQSVLTFYS